MVPTRGVWPPPKTTTCGIASTGWRSVAQLQFEMFLPLTRHNGGAILAPSNKGVHPMTEDQIERLVQHRTDRLDREYMAGGMTQEEYQRGIDAIDREYNTLLQSLSRAA